MNVICSRCWKAEHPLPPGADIDRIRDYGRYLAELWRIEDDFWGPRESLYDQHREAFARTGDPVELERMLRHVNEPAAPA